MPRSAYTLISLSSCRILFNHKFTQLGQGNTTLSTSLAQDRDSQEIQSLRLSKTSVRQSELLDFKSLVFCLLLLLPLTPIFSDSCNAEESLGESATQKSSELTTLVVTGAPLKYTLQEAPSSISLLDKEQIDRENVSFLQNQIQSIPNFNWAAGTSRPRFFQIRGIGDLEQYEGAPNSSVAVLLDGVDVTGIGAALTLFDVQQLEVHRGPQATRFGSSALAGAVSLTTAEPTPSREFEALTSFGTDSLVSSGVAGGNSVLRSSDALQFRASLFGHRQDGFRDNEFFDSDTTNERSEVTGRLHLLATLSPTSQVTVGFYNVDIDNGYDAFTIDNSFTTHSDRPGEDAEQFQLVNVRAEALVTDEVQLTSITSYYNYDLNYSFDGDWGSNDFWTPYTPYDYFSSTKRGRHVFAEQLQLESPKDTSADSAKWLLGAFFQSMAEDTTSREFSDNFEYDFLSSDYNHDTVAGFGGLQVPLSEHFSFDTGIRLERRQSYYDDSRDARFSPIDTMYGGHAALSYSLYDKQFLFTRISRGFRGGGFNPGPSVPSERRSYDPESLVSIEVGHRGQLWGDRVQLASTAFYNFRRDQQLKLAVQDDPSDPLSFTFITDNGARGRSFGLESEVKTDVTNRLTLEGSTGLLHTEITSVDPLLANLEGRAQSHAPEWQYSTRASYELTSRLTADAQVVGRAGFYFDDSHDSTSDLYHLFNSTLTYAFDSYEIQLWGRNLLNKRYAVRGFYFGLEPPTYENKEYVQLGDPRLIGISFRYKL